MEHRASQLELAGRPIAAQGYFNQVNDLWTHMQAFLPGQHALFGPRTVQVGSAMGFSSHMKSRTPQLDSLYTYQCFLSACSRRRIQPPLFLPYSHILCTQSDFSILLLKCKASTCSDTSAQPVLDSLGNIVTNGKSTLLFASLLHKSWSLSLLRYNSEQSMCDFWASSN